jgi:pullulanase/glycogen debranching enzyme
MLKPFSCSKKSPDFSYEKIIYSVFLILTKFDTYVKKFGCSYFLNWNTSKVHETVVKELLHFYKKMKIEKIKII